MLDASVKPMVLAAVLSLSLSRRFDSWIDTGPGGVTCGLSKRWAGLTERATLQQDPAHFCCVLLRSERLFNLTQHPASERVATDGRADDNSTRIF
ncbi:hypothetical protein RRG08_043120 [Elysia crispata]|uniref:Uncharacterized protein n=1 Tax=Elysia crispata TaxID=231223 RepID=A0AAE1CPU2_9GAST|nr:hypothetical protein RRG08_043120 [Elysia crispata]